MIDDTTPRYGLSLPHPTNNLNEDVVRLRTALGGVDGLIYSANTARAQLATAVDTQTHWADTVAMTYDVSGRVATMTETYGATSYVITLGYTSDLVTSVVTVGGGVQRTETLSYDGSQRLTGVVATEVTL